MFLMTDEWLTFWLIMMPEEIKNNIYYVNAIIEKEFIPSVFSAGPCIPIPLDSIRTYLHMSF